MDPQATSLDTLKDIRKMMEKSSRFISLSGWSGITAGICGLAGAFFANHALTAFYENGHPDTSVIDAMETKLLVIAMIVFTAAFSVAFLFTYLRSRKEGIPIWGQTARRLLLNTMLPMIAGGMVILRLIFTRDYLLIAPCALIFYGLALINGSKYTLGEIRYLGYIQLALGIINLWFPDQWLLLWTAGFGMMHIVYGIVMWWRYER